MTRTARARAHDRAERQTQDRSATRARHAAERGFTLVELLVYVLLMAVVLAIAAGMMMSGTRSSGYVQTSARAATEAQTVTRTITQAVRNAQQLWTSDALVVARDATNGRCLAWSLVADPDDAGAYRVYGRITDGPAQPITSAAPADGSGWLELAAGVRPIDADTPIFSSAAGADLADALGLDLRFAVDTATAPTRIDTSIVPRKKTPVAEGDPACIG